MGANEETKASNVEKGGEEDKDYWFYRNDGGKRKSEHAARVEDRPQIDIKEAVGTHEFTVAPRSMFSVDRSMLHCSLKSSLMCILEKLPAIAADLTTNIPVVFNQEKTTNVPVVSSEELTTNVSVVSNEELTTSVPVVSSEELNTNVPAISNEEYQRVDDSVYCQWNS